MSNIFLNYLGPDYNGEILERLYVVYIEDVHHTQIPYLGVVSKKITYYHFEKEFLSNI